MSALPLVCPAKCERIFGGFPFKGRAEGSTFFDICKYFKTF